MTRVAGQLGGLGRKNVARLVLLAGAVTMALALAPEVPRDHELRLVFRRVDTTPVRRVTLEWERPSDEPLGGATLYPRGASRELSYTLRLPSGEYVLNIEVETSQGPLGSPAIETHQYRVELQGEPTTLYLSDRK